VILIATLLSLIWTFADFQLVYILTRGGPANETHLFRTYASQIGLGAATSLYMFPILAFFAMILLFSLRGEQ
jgi:multiple sugar transport system permease protein